MELSKVWVLSVPIDKSLLTTEINALMCPTSKIKCYELFTLFWRGELVPEDCPNISDTPCIPIQMQKLNLGT